MMRHQDRVGWLYVEFPKDCIKHSEREKILPYFNLYRTFRKKEKGKVEGKTTWE